MPSNDILSSLKDNQWSASAVYTGRDPGTWFLAYDSNGGHMSFLIGNPYGKGLFDSVVEIIGRFNPPPATKILYLRDYYKFNLVLAGSNGLLLIILFYIAYRVVRLTKC